MIYKKIPDELRSLMWNYLKRFQLRQVTGCVRRMSTENHDLSDRSPLAKVRPIAAVAQMNCTGDVEANYAQGRDLISRAVAQGAQMVFLPECFDFVCERKSTLDAVQQCDGVILPRYQQLAKHHNVWLSLGGYHQKTAETERTGRIANTHVIVDSGGAICGRYSKMHLFDVDIRGGVRLRETDMTVPGARVAPPVTTPLGNVGMAICYDLRFPELSIALTQQKAHILTYPSAFTVPTGMAHWQVLLRSRAIENQCYVIAAAQVGQHHAKRTSYGHAMIVDPWGCVVAECSDQVGVAVTEIDLGYLEKRRTEMPVQSHRRHDLYGHVTLQQACDVDCQPCYQFGQHTVRSDQVFYRTPLSYAFVNRKPVLPGHVLVSSVVPVERFEGLSAVQVADLFTCVQRVSKAMERNHGCSSVTVAVQDGPEAGQTVKHFHVHILPRKQGDFERNDDIYTELQQHDKGGEAGGGWRSDADMACEAAQLRTLFS